MTTDADKISTSQATAPAEINRYDPSAELGQSGLSIWGGFLNEEYLEALKPWDREVRVYLEMRDYPVVGTLLDSIKMPLLAADITVEAQSDSPEDKAAAEFIEENMESMNRKTWKSHVMDALECLDFGFAFPEIILKKRKDGHLWLEGLEPRGQETLIRWLVEPDRPDKATAYVQGNFRSSMPFPTRVVPLSKSLHFTFRGRKGNPQGRSLLRSLYRPWRFASNIETFEGIGVERDVGGMPVLKLPESMRLDDPVLDTVKTYLKGLRMDKAVYMILPHGFTLEPYTGSTRTFNTREIVRDYHKQILMRGFAQFLNLGMERVGTQSLVKGSHDFFTLSLEAIQELIVEVWNHSLVPYLFTWNPSFGFAPDDVDRMPKISWEKPGKIDLVELVASMAQARGMDALTITREDEIHIRQAAGLPDLPDGVGEDVRIRTWDVRQEGLPGDGEPPSPGEGAEFARRAAGAQVRRLQGRAEKAVNAFQASLGRIYDPWMRETIRELSLPDRSFADIQGIMDNRLALLGTQLKEAGRREIGEAAFSNLGRFIGHAEKPQVVNALASSVAEFETYVDGTLINSIRQRFSEDFIELAGTPSRAARRQLAEGILMSRRPAVAFGAGRAWVAIFNVQRAAGEIEDTERQQRGEPPIPVRWVLDPNADHCADDQKRATFGCPTLAGEYSEGWSKLPTVPAGNVTCLGNCRCHIEANFGSGWERV